MSFKILCIGEILFDIYPQAKHLGGAPFNFAYHLYRLGNEVTFISRIGSDKDGGEILTTLQKYNFPVDFIQIDRDHQTGYTLVELDDKGAPNFTITPGVAYDFIEYDESIQEYLDHDVDLIHFGTLAQRNPVSQKTIHKILENRLPTTKVFYDINLRQNFYSEPLRDSLRQSDIIKLNEDEFHSLKQLFSTCESG